MDKPRIILGIDPGTRLLGFGVVRSMGKKAEYVDMGILDLRKEKDAYSKLRAIHECIAQVCRSYHPDALAIALCHHFEMSNPIASVKGKGGWEQFLKDHPDRIK